MALIPQGLRTRVVAISAVAARWHGARPPCASAAHITVSYPRVTEERTSDECASCRTRQPPTGRESAQPREPRELELGLRDSDIGAVCPTLSLRPLLLLGDVDLCANIGLERRPHSACSSKKTSWAGSGGNAEAWVFSRVISKSELEDQSVDSRCSDSRLVHRG